MEYCVIMAQTLHRRWCSYHVKAGKLLSTSLPLHPLSLNLFLTLFLIFLSLLSFSLSLYPFPHRGSLHGFCLLPAFTENTHSSSLRAPSFEFFCYFFFLLSSFFCHDDKEMSVHVVSVLHVFLNVCELVSWRQSGYKLSDLLRF